MKQQKLKNVSKTVTTAGTRVAVSATDLFVQWVRFECLHSNTGDIYVGGSDVSSVLYSALLLPTADKGVEYFSDMINEQGSMVPARINLKHFYIDAETSGEKCLVSYLEDA